MVGGEERAEVHACVCVCTVCALPSVYLCIQRVRRTHSALSAVQSASHSNVTVLQPSNPGQGESDRRRGHVTLCGLFFSVGGLCAHSGEE